MSSNSILWPTDHRALIDLTLLGTLTMTNIGLNRGQHKIFFRSLNVGRVCQGRDVVTHCRWRAELTCKTTSLQRARSARGTTKDATDKEKHLVKETCTRLWNIEWRQMDLIKKLPKMVKRPSIENEHKKNKEINATDKRNNEQKNKRFSIWNRFCQNNWH